MTVAEKRFEVFRAHMLPGHTWRDLVVVHRQSNADGIEPEYLTIALTYDDAAGLAADLIAHMPDHVRDACLALVQRGQANRDRGVVTMLMADGAPLPADEPA